MEDCERRRNDEKGGPHDVHLVRSLEVLHLPLQSIFDLSFQAESVFRAIWKLGEGFLEVSKGRIAFERATVVCEFPERFLCFVSLLFHP